MKEYAVHYVSTVGDEYIEGHFKNVFDAIERHNTHVARKHRNVYIVEREVTEWKKVTFKKTED